MAYYDALIAAWNNGATALPLGASGSLFISGDTTAQKLAKVNAWTAAAPAQDVPVSAVEGYLGLSGTLAAIEDWLATNPSPGTARTAAKELLRTIASPHVTSFAMSNPTTYATVEGMLNALAASPPSLLTATQVQVLLDMAATTAPWWRSAGYASSVTAADLAAAGGLT